MNQVRHVSSPRRVGWKRSDLGRGFGLFARSARVIILEGNAGYSRNLGELMRWITVVGCLASMILGLGSQGIAQGDPDKFVDLGAKSIAELEMLWDSTSDDLSGTLATVHGTVPRDHLLCELMKRPRTLCRSMLERKLQENAAKLKSAQDELEMLPWNTERRHRIKNRVRLLSSDLELVTVIRRMQERPDPLAVVVHDTAKLKAATRRLPTFDVSLTNVDVDKRALGLQRGGNYRSGRQSRWRIHVWDAEGNLLPELPSRSMIGGGPVFGFGNFKYGETWNEKLRMQDYVAIRVAGRYTVQILYHNMAEIADLPDPLALDRLIIFRSEPFVLSVDHGPKTAIALTVAEMQRARSLIQEINEKDSIRIFYGKYDETASDFIAPKSPQGELLTMSWNAVPAMIEGLDDRSLSFRRRAWLFAILISIVRERHLDPTGREGVLPYYRVRGDILYNAGNENSGGEINAEEDYGLSPQRALVNEWLRFRDEYLEIRVLD